MRLSDALAEIRAEDAAAAEEAAEGTETHEEEDFWEALDLLETARKTMLKLLKREDELGEVRRQRLQNHCDDIYQFLDNFLELDKPAAAEATTEVATEVEVTT